MIFAEPGESRNSYFSWQNIALHGFPKHLTFHQDAIGHVDFMARAALEGRLGDHVQGIRQDQPLRGREVAFSYKSRATKPSQGNSLGPGLRGTRKGTPGSPGNQEIRQSSRSEQFPQICRCSGAESFLAWFSCLWKQRRLKANRRFPAETSSNADTRGPAW